MDSTEQVLVKIPILIQSIKSSAEKANLNVKNCQTLALSIKSLEPLIYDLQESKVPFNGGAITCFEGLESVLCKAKSLIQKCGKETSRIYVVLKGERFASKFKLLAREIETHINLFTLGAVPLTERTQKQVEKCICELHEATYDVDGDPELLLCIKSALKEVKDGVKLSHEKLAELTSRLQLKLNQDILREAALLEKEKQVVRIEKDKHEEDVINQLLVLVTRMGDDLAEQVQAQLEFGGIAVPADFRCPLSLKLMSDPVIVASGQTYERVYIQQWLDEGYTTCPKTRQTLSHTNLIPNYTVKALIANWCEANRVPFPEPTKTNSLSPTVVSASSSLLPRFERNDSKDEYMGRDASALPVLSESQLPENHGCTRRRYNNESAGSSGHDNGSGDGLSHLSSQMSRLGLRENINHILPTVSRRDHNDDSMNSHSRNTSSSSIASSADDTLFNAAFDESSMEMAKQSNALSSSSDTSRREVQRRPVTSPFGSSNHRATFNRLTLSSSIRDRTLSSNHSMQSRASLSPSSTTATETNDSDTQAKISQLVHDLQSSSTDIRREAAISLRLLAKHSVENRILIANCGAIRPLVNLLDSTDPQTQENAVTALLNLSINDQNKSEIAAAGAIDPLVRVLKVGTPEAKENSAATLFSLSVMDENKVAVGQSGAIPLLVDLLIHGSPRGKKDAATALFNLSIHHENKLRIVSVGAVKPLVELMSDPAAGMVDKAVTVLANLATIPEGRNAIGEGGIPALVEVVEMGSQRGKENAAAALLQLCTNSSKFRAMVLQEGAIPPLVALSQSGTARAKEKASALLRHFREQRQAAIGRGVRHMDQRTTNPYA